MNKFSRILLSLIIWTIIIAIVGSCFYVCFFAFDEKSYNSNSPYDNYENELAHPDGQFTAEVNYYNFNTGTSSTYTLDVEVEDNYVTVIYWPNGGWLDDSHFIPQELDSNGRCSFTSDAGYDYEVTITDSDYFNANIDDYEFNPAEDYHQ